MNQTEKLILVENLLLSLLFFLSLSLTTETIFYFKSYILFIMRPIVFLGQLVLPAPTFFASKKYERTDIQRARHSEGQIEGQTFRGRSCHLDLVLVQF